MARTGERGGAVKSEPLTLTAADGYRLGCTVWTGDGAAGINVLIGSATGVPQGFYRRLAQFLAARGCGVLTLDYRGVGASKAGSLRGFRATFVDWARLDLTAGLEWCLERGPTAIVGHSFGAHAFGMLDRANETLGLYAFGAGAGWHGYMTPRERLRALAMWRVIGPVSAALCGYLPSRRIGLGEDLPLGVYQQWRRWCGYPRYFFDDPTFEHRAGYAAVRVPIVTVSASDDAWALPASRDAFVAGFERAPVERITVEAAPGDPIGHLGYFRPRAAHLWGPIWAWLQRAQDASRSARPGP